MEIGEPLQRVGDQVAPDTIGVGAIQVDRWTPGRPVAVRHVRAEVGQHVSLGPEVVVDHIEHDGEATLVTGADKVLEGRRTAIRVLDREGKDTVIPPVPHPRELGHRHDLHGGDAEFDQVVELGDRRRECAPPSEGAHMELVEHGIAQRNRLEPLVAPGVVLEVDDARRTVHAVWLKTRGRVGPDHRAIKDVVIAGSGAAREDPREPAFARILERDACLRLHELDLDALRQWSPDAEHGLARFERPRPWTSHFGSRIRQPNGGTRNVSVCGIA